MGIGYEVGPADIFASGVCFFIIMFKAPPWRAAMLEDAYFKYIYKRGDTGIAQLLQSWHKPLLSPHAMELLISMLQPNPSRRPTIACCLQSAWFQKLTHGC